MFRNGKQLIQLIINWQTILAFKKKVRFSLNRQTSVFIVTEHAYLLLVTFHTFQIQSFFKIACNGVMVFHYIHIYYIHETEMPG